MVSRSARSAARTAEIAWAAGLFEGEGTIAPTGGRVNRHGGRSWQLAVVSTDEDVVTRFVVAVGRGKVLGPYSREEWKQTWRWGVSSKDDVLMVGRLLLPLLCARRAARMEEAIIDVERTGVKVIPLHGTVNRYMNYGCKCTRCRKAMSEYNRARCVVCKRVHCVCG